MVAQIRRKLLNASTTTTTTTSSWKRQCLGKLPHFFVLMVFLLIVLSIRLQYQIQFDVEEDPLVRSTISSSSSSLIHNKNHNRQNHGDEFPTTTKTLHQQKSSQQQQKGRHVALTEGRRRQQGEDDGSLQAQNQKRMMDDDGDDDDDDDDDESTATTTTKTKPTHDAHFVAGLSCQAHGGPNDQDDDQARRTVQDMVYWRDIPQDAKCQSPHAPAPGERKKYLTFEPDEGGFNNIRMAFETAVALAVGTGRILVLPPEMNFYLLTQQQKQQGKKKKNQQQYKKKAFGFSDFYDLQAIAQEHVQAAAEGRVNTNHSSSSSTASAFQIMTFQEFLEAEAMAGTLLDRRTGKPTFPPGNRTDWNGNIPPNFLFFRSADHQQGNSLWHWLRQVAYSPEWKFSKCLAFIPQQPGPDSIQELNQVILPKYQQDTQQRHDNLAAQYKRQIKKGDIRQDRMDSFFNHPTPVNASASDRWLEMVSSRTAPGDCVYNEELQQAQVVHLQGEQNSGYRMLIHFYAFVFFQDWQQDLWMKRFIRDHFRYQDEIQCAAARIVHALRKMARTVNRKIATTQKRQEEQQQQPQNYLQPATTRGKKENKLQITEIRGKKEKMDRRHRRRLEGGYDDDGEGEGDDDDDDDDDDNDDEEGGGDDDDDDNEDDDSFVMNVVGSLNSVNDDDEEVDWPDTSFHTMHIRRGDFQFEHIRHMTSKQIYRDNIRQWFTPGKVLYIATDEKDKSSAFFEPFRKHYNVVFLDDFQHLLTGIDYHYYGMIEQLVAAQGDIFVGGYYSTFTGYITRLRGYFSQMNQWPGYETGKLRNTYYYVPEALKMKRTALLEYHAVKPAFWEREFPVAWRDLDHPYTTTITSTTATTKTTDENDEHDAKEKKEIS